MKHTFRYLVASASSPGGLVVLDAADSHHLARVVRRRAGDEVEIIDGDGNIWPAVVRDPAAGGGALIELGHEPRMAPRVASYGLAIGALEANRMDLVVEKATEMGAARIVVLASDRARRGPAADAWNRRRERLLRVATAAARQSGRGRTPAIEGPRAVAELVADGALVGSVMLDPRGKQALSSALAAANPEGSPLVLVGPEAGFSAEEVASARSAGLPVCGLGPGILRAETAAIVGLAIVLSHAGYLSPNPSMATEPEPA